MKIHRRDERRQTKEKPSLFAASCAKRKSCCHISRRNVAATLMIFGIYSSQIRQSTHNITPNQHIHTPFILFLDGEGILMKVSRTMVAFWSLLGHLECVNTAKQRLREHISSLNVNDMKGTCLKIRLGISLYATLRKRSRHLYAFSLMRKAKVVL